MEVQLKKSNVPINFTKNVDLDWAKEDLSRLIKQFTSSEYLLIFPFCSKNIQKGNGPFSKS